MMEPLESRFLLTVSLDANGWTQVTPTPGVSRQVYVSSSTGSDSNSGLSPSAPLATIAKAETMMRPGSPDWILLKRGDKFYEGVALSTSGVSTQQPMVFTNYGDPSLPRPVVDSANNTAIHTGTNNQYVDIIGINFTTSTHNPNSSSFNNTGSNGLSDSGTSNLLVEDCSFSYFIDDLVLETISSQITNVTIRRCEILDSFSTTSHSEGLYAQQINGLTLDQNIFDHDGWNSQVSGGGPTGYNHDAYLHSSNNGVVVTNNIFADASSVGLQARSGGIVDNNLFINDPYGLSFGLVNGSTTRAGGVSGEVIGNVILEEKVDTVNTSGIAMQIGNLMPGGNTVIANNIMADSSYNAPAIEFAPGDGDQNPQQEVGLNSVTFENNTVYNWGYGMYISNKYVDGSTGADGLTGVTIADNNFQDNVAGRIISHGNAFDPTQETWVGNTYSSTTASASNWFQEKGVNTSLGTWKATVEPTAVSKTLAFANPNRTIESYMAALGLSPSMSSFAAGALNQSSQQWNPIYSAQAVISYIQAGFSINGSSAPAPVAVVTPPPTMTVTNYLTTPAPTFSVTYTDNVALNMASISAASVSVTGPGGVSLPVIYTGTTGSGTFVTAKYTVTGLNNNWANTPNGTYTISLASAVQDSSGVSVATGALGSFLNAANSPAATSPAATPATFTASATSNSIKLSWSDPANDQTSFMLTRATDANFTQNVINVPLGANVTSDVDTSAILGQVYYYRLTATNKNGTSAPTATASAMIPIIGSPATTPVGFTAAAKTSGIILTWSDPTNDETGFTLTRATNAGLTQNVQTIALAANVLAYTDASAAVGQTYYYRLTAKNAFGASAPTATANAIIQPTAATMPVDFTAVASATSITLTWNDPANDQTGFTLTRATNSSFTQNVQNVSVSGSATSFSDTAAVAGVMYYYKLTATNAVGSSPPTPTVSATVSPKPATPTNFIAAGKPNTIVLSWTEPGNLQTGFTLTRATNSTFTQNVQNVPVAANATSFTDSSVVSNQTYYYKLTASNSVGTSAPTPTVSTKLTPVPPTAPINLTASATTTNIVLSWIDNANDQTGFTLTRATDFNFTQNAVSLPIAATARSFTDSSAAVGQVYYYKLSAKNAVGTSTPTATVGAEIAPPTVAAKTPTNFTAVAGTSSVVLSWSDPTNEQSSFKLVRATNVGFTQNVVNTALGMTVTRYTDTSVVTGQTYYYELIAINSGGNSAPTPAVGVTVAATIAAPKTPLSLAAAATSSSIVVTWSDPYNDQTGFTLTRSTNVNFTQNVTTVPLGATSTSYTDTSAVAGTTYYYKIVANNSGGTSAPSVVASASIAVQTARPTAPVNFNAVAGTSTISLAWSEPAGNQSGFTLVRATDVNFTQNVTNASLGASATSFNDASVVAGTTYYYKLVAVNSAGSSAPTATVSAVIVPPSLVATTPTNFTGVATSGGIVLSWSDPAKDQNGFVLVRATNSAFTQNVQSITLSAATTSFTDASAGIGQTYFYQIIAKNAVGFSAPTPAVMVTR
jgi:fibronectin type 3 domain-containing protein